MGCASLGEVQGGSLKEITVSVSILELWSLETLGLGVEAWNHRTQFIPGPKLQRVSQQGALVEWSQPWDWFVEEGMEKQAQAAGEKKGPRQGLPP